MLSPFKQAKDNNVLTAGKSGEPTALPAARRLPPALSPSADNVVLGDALSAFDGQWDVQGLSDWKGLQLPNAAQAMREPCNIYRWVDEPRASQGLPSSEMCMLVLQLRSLH